MEAIERGLRQEAISSVGTAPTYLITGILTLFFLAYGRRYLRGGLAQIADPGRRARAAFVLRDGLTRGRNALLVVVAQITVFTLISAGVLLALDVPTHFVLGLLIGVLSAMPYLGVVLGGTPALLIAYGFEGAGAAVAVLILLACLQAFEGMYLRPRFDPRTVSVGPLLPLAVALLGFELYGPGGVIYGYALVVIATGIYDAATRTTSSSTDRSP